MTNDQLKAKLAKKHKEHRQKEQARVGMNKMSAYEQGFVDGYEKAMQKKALSMNITRSIRPKLPKSPLLKPPKTSGSVSNSPISKTSIGR